MNPVCHGNERLQLGTRIGLVWVIILLPLKSFSHQYFECLDMCVSCTKERFNQPSYMVLKNVEDLLLKAANNDYTPEQEFVSAFDDFERSSLW